MKALCVGGSLNGQFHHVPRYGVLMVPEPPTFSKCLFESDYDRLRMTANFRTAMYRRLDFALSPERIIPILAHEDIHDATAHRYAADMLFAAWGDHVANHRP